MEKEDNNMLFKMDLTNQMCWCKWDIRPTLIYTSRLRIIFRAISVCQSVHITFDSKPENM